VTARPPDGAVTGPAVPLLDLGAMSGDVEDALQLAWKDVTAAATFIGGPAVERFEHQWASYCGTRQAVGVANGTDAIQLVLRALGIGPGDEVIVPANSFIATAEAVLLTGATPRFADVDPDTVLVTPESIEAAITARTAAVIVVDLYGNMPAIEPMVRLAHTKGLALVEDAAQAHGSTWQGRKAGSFGVAGCFSFYPGKNLGAFGGSGVVASTHAALAEHIRSLGNHGRLAGAAQLHAMLGTNSRLDALQAAVLSAKLPRLDDWNRARQAAAAAYDGLLHPAVHPVVVHDGARSVFHQYVVRVPNRDRVQQALAARGVQTGIHYRIPCHRQGPYRAFAADPLPVAEQAAGEILSLPMFPHLTGRQVEYVAECLNNLVGSAGAHAD
jgi:dTDP-4-amino-4,6-dideoxygalactose transaminase